MAKFKVLADLYRFPGFVPVAHIHGIFGEPGAVLLTLRRRRKKRAVAFVDKPIAVITTNGRDASAMSPAATNGFISSSNSTESTAHRAEA
jgi:hypothetical protein